MIEKGISFLKLPSLSFLQFFCVALAFNGLFWYSLANGNNILFPTLNMMDIVSRTFLPESGIMPTQFLFFPALVGAVVVGSFERRISGWTKKKKD